MEFYNQPSEIEHSKRHRYRRGIPVHPFQIANYLFFAKPGLDHFRRAIEFTVVWHGITKYAWIL